MPWTAPDLIRTLVAGGAAAISLVALFNSYKFSKETAKRAQIASAITGFNSKIAYRKNLMDWAGQVQDSLCDMHEAIIHTKDGQSTKDRIEKGLARLTSLIDRGRWLLPNENHELYGMNKESAYTGTRQDALELLVIAYDWFSKALHAEGSNEEVSKRIWQTRRQFTSIIQQKIEPRILDAELDALYRQLQT